MQMYPPHRHLYEEDAEPEADDKKERKTSDEFPDGVPLATGNGHGRRSLSRDKEDVENGSSSMGALEVEGPLRKMGSFKRKKDAEECASLLAAGSSSPRVR